jgi:hypothetical protein
MTIDDLAIRSDQHRNLETELIQDLNHLINRMIIDSRIVLIRGKALQVLMNDFHGLFKPPILLGFEMSM